MHTISSMHRYHRYTLVVNVSKALTLPQLTCGAGQGTGNYTVRYCPFLINPVECTHMYVYMSSRVRNDHTHYYTTTSRHTTAVQCKIRYYQTTVMVRSPV